MNAHMLVLQLPLMTIKQLIIIAAPFYAYDNTKKAFNSRGLRRGGQPQTLVIGSRSALAIWPPISTPGSAARRKKTSTGRMRSPPPHCLLRSLPEFLDRFLAQTALRQ